MNSNLIERFESKIELIPFTSCWIWNGSDSGGGYGGFWLIDRVIGAHVASYRIYRGPVPDKLLVLHTCDVRLCVNPDHLYIGTHSDNRRDMLLRNNVTYYNSEKVECKRGHLLSENNVYLYKDGRRLCRTCHRDYYREYMRNRREH